ncbi:hypothetical protein JCM9140_3566 [Halalkalibacter wakoensis JCM 9140]|uniref:Uncharacterized protein n=1 Tax=Halalkalibacter wakoensis JCM 9140 TaxID=1236970 RepID=W4Q7U7_9BACI|nr:hypothetical protein [Halalkalibacter wakoensis]GAE27419.1 hypothetical protein JCM9140_3566 [Halalkalibacter wakoensis JCM 9140]
MKLLKETDSDTLFPYIMTTGLLLVITAFFLPVIVVLFVQDMLFFSADHWTFIRPAAAYIGFGSGMILIAIVLFSFLLTKMYSEKKDKPYKWTGFHLVFLFMVVPLFVFSIYHYAYFDEQGVQGNSFWSLSETRISWEDVEEVTRLVEEGSLLVTAYTFSDGHTSITIPYDPQDYRTRQSITHLVNVYNWDVADIIEDREKK